MPFCHSISIGMRELILPRKGLQAPHAARGARIFFNPSVQQDDGFHQVLRMGQQMADQERMAKEAEIQRLTKTHADLRKSL